VLSRKTPGEGLFKCNRLFNLVCTGTVRDTLDLVLSYGLPVFNLDVCEAFFSEHMPVLFEAAMCSVKSHAAARRCRVIKAAVRNFYVSINIRFTQATTRGDDTTLIKPFGSCNTSLYFSVFVLFVFGVDERCSRAGAQEMTNSTRFYLTTRREESAARSNMAEKPNKRPRGSEVDRTAKKRPSCSAEGLLSRRESGKRR